MTFHQCSTRSAFYVFGGVNLETKDTKGLLFAPNRSTRKNDGMLPKIDVLTKLVWVPPGSDSGGSAAMGARPL